MEKDPLAILVSCADLGELDYLKEAGNPIGFQAAR